MGRTSILRITAVVRKHFIKDMFATFALNVIRNSTVMAYHILSIGDYSILYLIVPRKSAGQCVFRSNNEVLRIKLF